MNQHFKIDTLKISDDSDKHKGHPESAKSGGGHFSIYIVSEDFSGVPLIKRHRQIYEVLKNAMRKDIHALAITAKTPEEINL